MVGPGQQLVDSAVWVMVDDPDDDVSEVELRIDVAEFARLD